MEWTFKSMMIPVTGVLYTLPCCSAVVSLDKRDLVMGIVSGPITPTTAPEM